MELTNAQLIFPATQEIANARPLWIHVLRLRSAGIFRGDRALDKVLEIACEAVKDNVYEGESCAPQMGVSING